MRILGGVLVILVALACATGTLESRTPNNAGSRGQPDISDPLPIVDFDLGSSAPTDVALTDERSSTDTNSSPDDDRCYAAAPGGESSMSGATIVVDPGHGGEDLGTVNTVFELQESELVLSISRMLRDQLTDSGANVCLTRIGDRNLALRERADLANRWDGDVFVSIHLNRLPDPNENYTMTMWGEEAKDRHLAETMLSVVAEELASPETYSGHRNPMSPDVVRIENLDSSMLRTADMPAVLVEASFLSNTWEARAILDGIEDGSRWREQQIAEAIYQGLDEYFSAIE